MQERTWTLCPASNSTEIIFAELTIAFFCTSVTSTSLQAWSKMTISCCSSTECYLTPSTVRHSQIQAQDVTLFIHHRWHKIEQCWTPGSTEKVLKWKLNPFHHKLGPWRHTSETFLNSDLGEECSAIWSIPEHRTSCTENKTFQLQFCRSKPPTNRKHSNETVWNFT